MSSINTNSIDKYIADNTINKILGWLGCFFVCVGAIAVTLDLDPINIYTLNIGAIIYGIWESSYCERIFDYGIHFRNCMAFGINNNKNLSVEEDGNPQVSKTLRSQFDSDDLRQL